MIKISLQYDINKISIKHKINIIVKIKINIKI